MSGMMDFYAGDAKALAAAYEGDPAADLPSVGGVRGHVDFSLHLTPDTLDELLGAACEAAGVERLAWWDDALSSHLAGDADESSLDVVDPAVVDVFAGVEFATFLVKARPWLGDTLTPDLQRATEELLGLCKAAKRDGMDVVFAWSP
jgi:hypothetical protein